MDTYEMCITMATLPPDSCTEVLTQKLYVCDHLVQTIKISWTLYNEGDSCRVVGPTRTHGQPNPPPPCDSTQTRERQINRDARKRQADSSLAAGWPGASTSFEIPIGTEFGDSLYLYRFAFLPPGWTFAVSDSGWMQVPDTLYVTMTHDDPVPPGDTGRVVFYAYNDRDEFAGTAEVFVYDPGPVVDVDDDNVAMLPATFELGQNYPNPFNAGTAIDFALPQPSHVSIEIFNVLGQRVRVLVDRPLAAGRHRITWDGRDESGQTVASGTYAYRIQAGDFVETRKMVILK
jgi:hypothetical protein